MYWYRRTLASLDCDATDTTSGRPANNASGNYFEGRPDGWQTMPDVVYVASFLKSPGTITVTSGGQTRTESAPAGAHIFTVPADVGQQKFGLVRGGATVMQETSLMDISNVCPCGLYNFNAYVGTVPHGPSDPLVGGGLASLTIGLHVSTCQAKPSLGTNPPVTSNPGNPGTTTTTTTPGNPPPTSSHGNPPPTSSSSPPPGQVCVEGTVADGESGNYTGLCQFSCNYGYCPPGPCKCTRYGKQVSPPPETGTRGCPLQGEPDGYKGLCSYTCNHGYCPNSACRAC